MFRLVFLSVCLSLGLGAAPIADTKYGPIQGAETATNVIYHGVPYAQPPVGALRWAPPKEPASWAPSVYTATHIKPGCPQFKCDALDPPMVCPQITSEDCLYLNIWAPLGTNATSSLAVMVYIHGGNFVHMSGGSLLYDGSILTQKGDIILVNVDYRLGALGFLVTGKGEGDAVGNYGILDQRQALKWVSENIKAFGGDPSRVTMFGQSAGAQSTMIHLGSAESGAYFRNAIIESAPFAIPYKTYPEALLLGAHMAKLLNCTARDLGCLRQRNSADIAYAQYLSRNKLSSLKLLEDFEPWGPWVDGVIVTGEPVTTMDKGHFQRKPIMLGTTSEETRLYIYGAWNKPVDNVLYEAAVTATHPNHAIAILREYPANSPQDERDNLVALATDYVFGCPTRHVTHEIVKYGIADVWLYIYDHAFSFPGWGNLTFCQGYVCHGSEVPFVFQSAGIGGFKYTPEELVLSDLVISYWSNFAKTGNPQGVSDTGAKVKAVPDWPQYHSENQWPYQHFKTPSSFVDTYYNAPFCDFWDKVGYNN
ncbi:cAMP-regulated D2 protein-like [Haliotis rufescens]|uniref:cAMP-regulated D2 protein-like n=1 Tax=Haliotis rufescens TaxID=6454 RepID=UPI00201F64A7|nr:cAMP-regulated D2 protein-like [Haliotis rufescens]